MGLRVGGLSSGLDTNALIDSVLALERRPLELVQQRKARLENEQSIFRELNTRLLALREAAAALDNRSTGLTGKAFEEELLGYRVVSTDENVLTATVDASARAGSTEVRVDELAKVERQVSSVFSSETDPIGRRNRRLTITPTEGDRVTINFDARNTSLTELRDRINQDPNNDGFVRAEILYDGSGYRLVMSGAEPGAANGFTVGGDIRGDGGRGGFRDDSLRVPASDASLQIGGIPITRTANVVTDVIPGVSLSLRGAGQTEVQVSRDDEAIAARVQTFVDAYNEVVDFIGEQSRFDPTAERAGPLSGDFTFRGVGQRVQRTLVGDYGFSDNPFTSLAQIGIGLGEGGRLALDAEAFSQALDQDQQGVREIFGGDPSLDVGERHLGDGIATAIARALDEITDADKRVGTIAARQDGYDDQIHGLDRQIERLERRLERREELLVLQFTQLETTLARLQNQGNSLLTLVTQRPNSSR